MKKYMFCKLMFASILFFTFCSTAFGQPRREYYDRQAGRSFYCENTRGNRNYNPQSYYSGQNNRYRRTGTIDNCYGGYSNGRGYGYNNYGSCEPVVGYHYEERCVGYDRYDNPIIRMVRVIDDLYNQQYYNQNPGFYSNTGSAFTNRRSRY